jgi:hypothetical protein
MLNETCNLLIKLPNVLLILKLNLTSLPLHTLPYILLNTTSYCLEFLLMDELPERTIVASESLLDEVIDISSDPKLVLILHEL